MCHEPSSSQFCTPAKPLYFQKSFLCLITTTTTIYINKSCYNLLPWNFLEERQNWEESLPSGTLCLVPPCLTGDYSICFDALWICEVAWGHPLKTRVFRSSRIANAKWVRKAVLFKVPQTFQAVWQIQHVLHVYSVQQLSWDK